MAEFRELLPNLEKGSGNDENSGMTATSRVRGHVFVTGLYSTSDEAGKFDEVQEDANAITWSAVLKESVLHDKTDDTMNTFDRPFEKSLWGGSPAVCRQPVCKRDSSICTPIRAVLALSNPCTSGICVWKCPARQCMR